MCGTVQVPVWFAHLQGVVVQRRCVFGSMMRGLFWPFGIVVRTSSACPNPVGTFFAVLTWLLPAGARIPRLLVGAGLPAATGEGPGQPRCVQPRAPEPRRPQASAQGDAAAAVHPAPLAAERPGLPGVQQHRPRPLSR